MNWWRWVSALVWQASRAMASPTRLTISLSHSITTTSTWVSSPIKMGLSFSPLTISLSLYFFIFYFLFLFFIFLLSPFGFGLLKLESWVFFFFFYMGHGLLAEWWARVSWFLGGARAKNRGAWAKNSRGPKTFFCFRKFYLLIFFFWARGLPRPP